MTQKDLGDRVHRHASWVSQMESGKIRLKVTDIVEIAFELRVDPSILMAGILPRGRFRRRRGTGGGKAST